MSVQNEIKRRTAPDIRARKGGEPIVVLTSVSIHATDTSAPHTCNAVT